MEVEISPSVETQDRFLEALQSDYSSWVHNYDGIKDLNMRCSFKVVELAGDPENAAVERDSGVEGKLALIRLRERSTGTEEANNLCQSLEEAIDFRRRR
ncbi:hypothetical protein JCGZ_23790 [Jatropha curcas]|uniref:Uncharacterized protein n=1 Tax=Jatropha curcas TaxID=180498 RepID=A0A067L6K1_JATCU|nr:hypothetical protein JCGZ_23790 [Jatropha curcas]